MTPAAIATKSEQEAAEICDCGHIRGIHSNRKAMEEFDLQLGGVSMEELARQVCSACQCGRFRLKGSE